MSYLLNFVLCSLFNVGISEIEIFYKKLRLDAPSSLPIEQPTSTLVEQPFNQQLLELNNRFDEIYTELLICMASLSPRNSFSSFEK